MSDLMLGIKTLLTNAWKFFSQTDVPGTDISFAVFAVGLALIPVSPALSNAKNPTSENT